MLKCSEITCTRFNKTLFNKIDFVSKHKSITIIKGKNGAGKTSLLKIIVGLLPMSSGYIEYNNKPTSDCKNFFSSITYISHKNGCSTNLTVLENLEFWAGLRNTKELILPTIYYFELQGLLDVKYSYLSVGWKRKLALSRLLINNTNIWIIDEPFTHLDQHSKKLVIELILAKKEQNGLIILSDHSEILDTSSQIINIDDFK